MRLTSSVFSHNQFLPKRYTCDGEKISPPLNISDIPSKAVSLVLIVDDPDSPNGQFAHWLVWNIPPLISKIEENISPPEAIVGFNDFGTIGYGPPCPPSGLHHYQFKLFALDSFLDISLTIKKIGLEQAMQTHILDQTVLIGLVKK